VGRVLTAPKLPEIIRREEGETKKACRSTRARRIPLPFPRDCRLAKVPTAATLGEAGNYRIAPLACMRLKLQPDIGLAGSPETWSAHPLHPPMPSLRSRVLLSSPAASTPQSTLEAPVGPTFEQPRLHLHRSAVRETPPPLAGPTITTNCCDLSCPRPPPPRPSLVDLSLGLHDLMFTIPSLMCLERTPSCCCPQHRRSAAWCNQCGCISCG